MLVPGPVCIQSILGSAELLADLAVVATAAHVEALYVVPHAGGLAAGVATIRAGPQPALLQLAHLLPDSHLSLIWNCGL